MALRALLAASVVLAALTHLFFVGSGGEEWVALEIGRPVDSSVVVVRQTAAPVRSLPSLARLEGRTDLAMHDPLNDDLTVMTYNIRFGRRDDGRLDLESVAGLLRRHDPDIIALQKVERFSPRSGFRDQVRWLAAALEMDVVYGPTVALGPMAYGNAVLSRHPLTPVANHVLPSRLEPRAMLEVEVETPLGPVRVYNTHLGLNGPERQKQSRMVLNHAASSPVPVIIAGDWNATPEQAEVEAVSALYVDAFPAGAPEGEAGYTLAFNSPDANRRIDYIFVDRQLDVVASYVVPEWISNHYPVGTVLRHPPASSP